MPVCRVLLVLSIALLVSCSREDELLPITTRGFEPVGGTDFLGWKTGPGFGVCSGGRLSTASGFVGSFSAYTDVLPFALVSWAVDSRRVGGAPSPMMLSKTEPCFEIPARQTWADSLKTIGSWAGPYRTTVHPGFVEIVWAGAAEEQQTRDRMSEHVPPILFRSRRAADFLTMWHAVSGMRFRYDPSLVQESLRWDEARLMEDSDPELPLSAISEESSWSVPLGFVQFQTSKTLSIPEFLPRLAGQLGGLARWTNRGWVIEKFQRNPEGLRVIEECLFQIRAELGDAQESANRLARIGAPALPEILREFLNPKADLEVVRTLLHVLSAIPGPERDRALLTELEHGFRGLGLPGLTIQALVRTGSESAKPLLEKLSRDPRTDGETPIAARIALNALGRVPVPESEVPALRLSPSVSRALEGRSGGVALQLLRAVLGQCSNGGHETEIREVDLDRPAGMVLSGTRKYGSGESYGWGFYIPVLRDDRALVVYGYGCGELCGASHLGRLEKRNGRWVVTRWRLLSMS